MENINEAESKFFGQNDKAEVPTYSELMKKTGRELAEMAAPFTDKSVTTLSKMAKKDLIKIIQDGLAGKVNEKEQEAKARKNRTKSEAEQLIEAMIHTLEAFKVQREHKPLNPVIKKVFEQQAVNYTSKKVEEDNITPEGINKALLFGTGALLLVDGLVGFENIPKIIEKIKKKVKRKGSKKHTGEPYRDTK